MNTDREHILGMLLAVLIVAVLVIIAVQHNDDSQAATLDVERGIIHDTIKVVEQRLRVDTVRARADQARSDTAIAASDSAIAKVEAVADTSAFVPTSLVLPEIQACKAVQHDLLEQIDGLKVDKRDLAEDVSLQTQRAELAERAEKKEKHRFGFKSGVATGVTLLALVLHFAR